MLTTDRVTMADVLPMLIQAVENNAEKARLLAGSRSSLNGPAGISFVRDYKTMRLDMGGRSGKSFSIEKTAGPDDLVIFDNESMFKSSQHLKCQIAVMSHELAVTRRDYLLPRHFKRIFVDESSWYPYTSNTLVKTILQNYVGSIEEDHLPTIVLIG